VSRRAVATTGGPARPGGGASPPTDRVVRVLEAVATPGAGPPNAADIARRAGVTTATCHAVLTALTDAGYLVRDPAAKTYRLGPALIPLGEAAKAEYTNVAVIRPDLDRLARDTGLPCTVAARSGNDILFVEHVGGGGAVRIGHRIPCAPPFGAIHVAWSDDATVADWIARTPRPVSADLRRRYRRLLAGIRDHGYAVSPLDDAALRLSQALADLADHSLSPAQRAKIDELLGMLHPHDYLPADLAGAGQLAVNTVTAPLFGPDARTALVVTLHVQQRDVPVDQIRRLAGRLLDATARMTEILGGTPPGRAPRQPTARSGDSSKLLKPHDLE
jgi:DNA-binding IclR family transcriptional regulator